MRRSVCAVRFIAQQRERYGNLFTGVCPSETLMVQTAGTIVPSSFAATR